MKSNKENTITDFVEWLHKHLEKIKAMKWLE
jgi:hypothetical protein